MQEFEILGQKIVVTNPSELETAALAFQLVHDEVEKIKKLKPLQGPHSIATLALLGMAAKLVQERQCMDQYRSKLDHQCSDLMKEVNAWMNVEIQNKTQTA